MRWSYGEDESWSNLCAFVYCGKNIWNIFCKSYTSATRLLKCFSFIRQKDPSHNLHCLGLFQTGQCLPDVLTSQAHHLKKRLDPIQIHCLKACTGVFRSSSSASLCRVELNPEREFHHYIMGTPSPASRSPRCWFQVIQVHSFIMMKKIFCTRGNMLCLSRA